jgi:hypothetical protein
MRAWKISFPPRSWSCSSMYVSIVLRNLRIFWSAVEVIPHDAAGTHVVEHHALAADVLKDVSRFSRSRTA